MRVLHLTTEFPPFIYGGLGTAIGGLVGALVRSGTEVAVLMVGSVAGSGYGEFKLVPRSGAGTWRRSNEGATIFEVSWFQDLDAVTAIVAKWQAHILHLHSFWLWPIAQAIRVRLGIPLVYTVHSLDRAEYEHGAGPPQCLGQWVQQEAVIYGADRVISLTHNERELLRDYCPGTEGCIRVVGNGIEDISRSSRTKQQNDEAPVVLFSGRFVERKGIRELVDAIGIVLAKAPEVHFVLAGGHRDCTARQMESWLLADRFPQHRSQIHFTGWLTSEELADWYDVADILVVPSWYEPFGMVVLEGMIHGLAVAASGIGGPAEILKNGETGLLFPPRNAEALAQAILRLVNDSELRLQIAAAGTKEVLDSWLWPQIVKKIVRVYEEVTVGSHE